MEAPNSKYAIIALGGIIGLFILGYINHASAIRESRTECLANNISPARCECILAYVASNISFLADMPLIGGIFAPSPARSSQIQQYALRSC